MFGGVTIADMFTVLCAIVFLLLLYKKISDYLIKRHDAEQEKDKQIKAALEATSHYPEYRQQSLQIQQQLTADMQKIEKTLEEHTKRLEKMENDSRKRELNKLRDTLLQNYKYYTNKDKNPLQAWTTMESDAFWELFGDYEDMGGNGYMHSIVLPAMQLLNVIDMHNCEEVSELMRTRK